MSEKANTTVSKIAEKLENTAKKGKKSESEKPPPKQDKARLQNSATLSAPSSANNAGNNDKLEPKIRKKDPKKTSGGTGKTPENARVDKLDLMLQEQSKKNTDFQHHMLELMQGLMTARTDSPCIDNVDNDDDSYNAVSQAQTHPISDDEDDFPSTSAANAGDLAHQLKLTDTVTDNNSTDESGTSKQNVSSAKDQNDTEKSPIPTKTTDKDGGFADIFSAESETGGTIRDDIATTLDKTLVNPYDEKKVQVAMLKVKMPENCKALQVPKVNLPIWSNIRPKTRSTDLKLQRVQKPLIKGLTALAKLDNDQSLTQDLKEAFLLLSVANFELNCVRKEMIKPDLNPEFHHLCSPKNKVTDWLFGDDLGKQVKDLQEESKATRGVMRGSAKHFQTRKEILALS